MWKYILWLLSFAIQIDFFVFLFQIRIRITTNAPKTTDWLCGFLESYFNWLNLTDFTAFSFLAWFSLKILKTNEYKIRLLIFSSASLEENFLEFSVYWRWANVCNMYSTFYEIEICTIRMLYIRNVVVCLII